MHCITPLSQSLGNINFGLCLKLKRMIKIRNIRVSYLLYTPVLQTQFVNTSVLLFHFVIFVRRIYNMTQCGHAIVAIAAAAKPEKVRICYGRKSSRVVYGRPRPWRKYPYTYTCKSGAAHMYLHSGIN